MSNTRAREQTRTKELFPRATDLVRTHRSKSLAASLIERLPRRLVETVLGFTEKPHIDPFGLGLSVIIIVIGIHIKHASIFLNH